MKGRKNTKTGNGGKGKVLYLLNLVEQHQRDNLTWAFIRGNKLEYKREVEDERRFSFLLEMKNNLCLCVF